MKAQKEKHQEFLESIKRFNKFGKIAEKMIKESAETGTSVRNLNFEPLPISGYLVCVGWFDFIETETDLTNALIKIHSTIKDYSNYYLLVENWCNKIRITLYNYYYNYKDAINFANLILADQSNIINLKELL